MVHQKEMRFNILMTGGLIIYMFLVHHACAPVLVDHDNWKYVQNYAFGVYLHFIGLFIYFSVLKMTLPHRRFTLMQVQGLTRNAIAVVTLGTIFLGSHWIFCSEASPLANRDDWVQWIILITLFLLKVYCIMRTKRAITKQLRRR